MLLHLLYGWWLHRPHDMIVHGRYGWAVLIG